MQDKRVFCGWIQVDIRPFKLTLMNVIKKWSWMFKEHLLNHVIQRLDTHTKASREESLYIQRVVYNASKVHKLKRMYE